MGEYQFGTGVGVMAGPASARAGGRVGFEGDGAGRRGVLGPDTESGQAILVAVIGFVILLLTVGRREENWGGKIGAALEIVLVVGAAMWISNYMARSYAFKHPASPLAAGFHFDA